MIKILVVEDVVEMSALIALTLGAEGYEIIQAADSEEALDLVYEEKPDLILMDVILPGINGFEVARLLKIDPDTHHLPIIFLTSKNQTPDVVHGLDLGVDYIVKPFAIPEMIARVRNAVETFCQGK